MDGHGLVRFLMQGVGALLMLLALADVFLTVLYARAGSTIVAQRVARLTWHGFRAVARVFPRRRGVILSFAGPVLLVVLVLVWSALLTVGSALVLYPGLGTLVRASGEDPTPRDFVTALYAGAGSITIVGASEYTPRTGPAKLFYLFDSLVGVTLITLVLTYYMQVYSSLQRRNTVALRLHLETDETGDAAELIVHLCRHGQLDRAAPRLSDLADDMANLKETHHFYSLLMFFRFRESFYSVTHVALVVLDSVSLIKSALDDRRYASLKESAAVQDLWAATMRLLVTVAPALLPEGTPRYGDGPDEPTRARWQRRHRAALHRLRQAGIQTIADERVGAETYVNLRARWDRYIVRAAEFMAYDAAEIDPAGAIPDEAAEPDAPAADSRLRSAG